jgi:hypothetical protein
MGTSSSLSRSCEEAKDTATIGRLVHMPVAKRVTKVLNSELLAVFDSHSGLYRRRPKMVSADCGRG